MKLIQAKSWVFRHPDQVIISAWVVAVMAAFLPGLIRGNVVPKSAIWFCEMALLHLPYWNYTGAMLRAGLIPTWASQVYCGFPYFSFPGTNLYYPPFYLLMFLDFPRASSLESLVCYALGGAFAHLGFRRLGLSPLAALVGMMTSVGCLYLSWESANYWGERDILAMALCGWGVAGLCRVALRLRYWFGVVLGLLLISYHSEVFTYTALFFWAVSWCLGPPRHRWKPGLVVSFALGMVGLAMGAAFLGLSEYLVHSVRAFGLTFDNYLRDQFPGWFLVGTVIPFFMVLPFFTSFISGYSPLYLGLSALWLGAVAVVRRGGRTLGPLLGVVLVLMLALDIPPLARLTYYLPVLNRLALHYYVFPAAVILIATLAGQGAEEVMETGFRSRGAWGIAIFLSLLLAASAVRDHSLLRAPGLIALVAIAGIAFFRGHPLNSRARRAAWITAWVALDIPLLSLSSHPRSTWSRFDSDPEALQLLERIGRERFWTLSKDYFYDSRLNPNLGMRLNPFLPGTSCPLGYWRVPPLRTAELVNLISPGYLQFVGGKLDDLRRQQPTGPHPFGPQALPLLSLLNVGWIISHGIDLPEMDGLERHAGKEDLFFHNPTVLPRARAVSRWQVAKDGAESLAAVSSGQLNFSEEAVIESRSGLVSGSAGTGPAHPVGVNSTRPGFWDLELPTGQGGQGAAASLLVVAETLMPGWRAFLDGREVPIHYAYHAFMGVMIPPGPHRVILVHRPWAFRIGIWLSLISMMAWPVLILARSFRPSAAPAQ